MRWITFGRLIANLMFRGERPVVFEAMFRDGSVSVNAGPDMIFPSYFNDLLRF